MAIAASVLVQTKLQNPNQPQENKTIIQNSQIIQSNEPVSNNKAVIIDQLDSDISNKYFEQKATQYLNMSGYQVDLFTTKDITVDFYKNLPSMNYKFIIIRTHGLEEPDNSTMLFTGERYNLTKHVSEQLVHEVGIGVPFTAERLATQKAKNETDQEFMAKNRYFTVGAKFVDNSMVGQFPDSFILIGGCEAVGNHDLAKSLIYRGASQIVGWPKSIISDENDQVMLSFLAKVLQNKTQVKEAVEQINQEYGHNMAFPAILTLIMKA